VNGLPDSLTTCILRGEELGSVTKGCGMISFLYVLRGGLTLADPYRVKVVRQDEVFIYQNDDRIRVQDVEARTEVLVLACGPGLHPADACAFPPFLDSLPLNPIPPDNLISRLLKNCLLSIYAESTARRRPSSSSLVMLFYKLAGICFEYMSATEETNECRDTASKRFVRVVEYVHRHYAEEISIQQAARLSGFSVPHFSRLFKMWTGLSFARYVSAYRLRQAAQLLKTDRQITDIAFDCGFGSAASFIRGFKKTYGMTPTRYRELINC